METHAELSTFGGWQVPYFCLTLVEKAAEVAPKQASSMLCTSAFLPTIKHHHRGFQGTADAHNYQGCRLLGAMLPCQVSEGSKYLQVAYSAASSLWLVLPLLLTHAHLWVRKAVLRLLSLGLSDSTLGEGSVPWCAAWMARPP